VSGPDLQIVRDVDQVDVDAISDLLDAVSAHDGHEALGEHKWLDLVHGGRRGLVGIVAREPGHPHVVGYAHISRTGSDQWGLEVVVHPEHRGIGIELMLARTALGEVGAAGGGHVHMWVFKPTDIHDGLAHRLGLRRGRDLLQLRRPLDGLPDPVLPEGISLRAFRPGVDDDAWLRVNNRAFRHHPEQGAWDADTLRQRIGEDWFDAAGFLLAVDAGDGLAGFCWTKVHPDDRLGEIYVIGVDPAHEGTGLGKALVLAGLQHLAGVGMPEGMLYVDASNKRAVALYERLGFHVDHVDRAYVTDVAPLGTVPAEG